MLIDLTPAEVNITKQALRAEQERMKNQGYNALAILAGETLSKIRNAELDNALAIVQASAMKLKLQVQGSTVQYYTKSNPTNERNDDDD